VSPLSVVNCPLAGRPNDTHRNEPPYPAHSDFTTSQMAWIRGRDVNSTPDLPVVVGIRARPPRHELQV